LPNDNAKEMHKQAFTVIQTNALKQATLVIKLLAARGKQLLYSNCCKNWKNRQENIFFPVAQQAKLGLVTQPVRLL